jgi:hypothetical protein
MRTFMPAEPVILCRKPDANGVFNPRCRHVIKKPRGETSPRTCRRAALAGTLFCDAHQETNQEA